MSIALLYAVLLLVMGLVVLGLNRLGVTLPYPRSRVGAAIGLGAIAAFAIANALR